VQADSEERNEIETLTALIDLKSEYKTIDIYDLDRKNHVKKAPFRTLFYGERASKGVGTDLKRKNLTTTDWFYSELYRKTLRQFCSKLKIAFPHEV
jgi:hypothetical protein